MIGKALSALLAAVIAWLLAALTGDQHISTLEAVNGLLVALSVAAVYVVPNLTGDVGKYSKLVVYFLTAGASLLVTGGGALLDGGVTITEWLQVLTVALAAIGVRWAPSPKVVATGARTTSGHIPGEQHP